MAYQRGDHRALELLIGRFEKPMRCVARRYLRCGDDIDDAVQDAWISFARSASTIESPLAVGGWLCVTTARAALSIARRQARCRPVDASSESWDPAGEPDVVGLASDVRAVHEALMRLDERDRELVWLLFGSDLSYAEITARTGRAIGGIGPTRKRVIAKLRKDRSIRVLAASRAV